MSEQNSIVKSKYQHIIDEIKESKLAHVFLINDPLQGLSIGMHGSTGELINMLGNVALQNKEFHIILKQAVMVADAHKTVIKAATNTPQKSNPGQSRPPRKNQE